MSNPLAADRYPGLEYFSAAGFGLPFNGASPGVFTFQLPAEGTWMGDVFGWFSNPSQSAWSFGSLVWFTPPGFTNRLLGSAFSASSSSQGGAGRSITVAPPNATGQVAVSLAFDQGTAVTKFSVRLYRLRLPSEYDYEVQ